MTEDNATIEEDAVTYYAFIIRQNYSDEET